MGELISPASTWRYIHWCSGIWTHLRWKERSFGLQDDNLVHFLTTVSLQEFIIRHVATTDSDNELVVHDLSVNLTASELKAYACRGQVSMNKCRYEGEGMKWNEWMNEQLSEIKVSMFGVVNAGLYLLIYHRLRGSHWWLRQFRWSHFIIWPGCNIHCHIRS